jgi:alpha-beta hydrolase superfamily lysophospholipase
VAQRLAAVGAIVAAIALSGAAAAATPRELTIPMSDGVQLSCALVEPDGAPPTGGWPAVILFHGLGGRHQDLEPAATSFLAPAGFASLMCDARGHGASGGLFDLDGPRDVQDTEELYSWFAARPEISDTAIGALGISLGGGAVWNAVAAGVPFKAIVPVITWTNLITALAPQTLTKSGLVPYLAGLVPTSRWDPELVSVVPSFSQSKDFDVLDAIGARRSVVSRLPSISVPTLLIQGRHDFLFDIDQAEAAYKRLTGPRQLYLGDLGHSPATNPSAEQPYYFGLAVKWFEHFLKGQPGTVTRQVELAHDPWDGKTTTYAGLPPTKTVSVALPGTSAIESGGKVVRGARVTGGPHETFGDSTVTVRYSGAKDWDRLVAVLAVAGSSTPITTGGVKLTSTSGVATIRLLNESVLVRAGARLVLYLGATSTVQSRGDALFLDDVRPGSSITVGRATLTLSVLKKAVSR